MMTTSQEAEGAVSWLDKIEKLAACQPAMRWLREEGFQSLEEAWQACTRPDWMLWLLGRLSTSPESPQRIALLPVLCDYAELEDSGEDPFSLAVLKRVRAWLRGESQKPNVEALYAELEWHARTLAQYNLELAISVIRVLDAIQRENCSWAAGGAASGPKAMEAGSTIVRRHFPHAPNL
jgi:hypothetical protein